MPYLNVDTDYFIHPKTVRLITTLGPGTAEYPIRLWAFAAKFHYRKGVLKGYTKAELERLLEWHGEPGLLVENLLRIGFLLETANGFKIKDWEEHEGHIMALKKRATNAAIKRWKLYAERNNGNAKPMLEHSLSNTPNQTIHTIPNHTKPTTKKQEFDFNALWLKYPRKLGRGAALKRFLGSVKTEKDFSDISLALENYVAYSKTQEERYVKHGSTWFGEWRDWIDYKPTRSVGNGLIAL